MVEEEDPKIFAANQSCCEKLFDSYMSSLTILHKKITELAEDRYFGRLCGQLHQKANGLVSMSESAKKKLFDKRGNAKIAKVDGSLEEFKNGDKNMREWYIKMGAS